MEYIPPLGPGINCVFNVELITLRSLIPAFIAME